MVRKPSGCGCRRPPPTLGSGFDAAAVALNFFLDIEAEAAAEFSIVATGQDSKLCSRLKHNLILEIYSRILAENGQTGNGPSRSACRMTFRLEWDVDPRLQAGLPQSPWPSISANSAGVPSAFWKRLAHWKAIRITPPPVGWADLLPQQTKAGQYAWRVLNLQRPGVRSWCCRPQSLATSKARAVLPASYTSADVVANLQAVSMLGLGICSGPWRPAASRNARSDPPALSCGDVPDVAEACFLWPEEAEFWESV